MLAILQLGAQHVKDAHARAHDPRVPRQLLKRVRPTCEARELLDVLELASSAEGLRRLVPGRA